MISIRDANVGLPEILPESGKTGLIRPRERQLSHAQMYDRLLASDTSYNGRFFTGVLTTGIYCLPSCKARKPKLENVRFFTSVEAARAAGLRPCRKCHPDDFASGADPVLECIETLVAEVRADPAAFPDAKALVRRSGFGATRLFELFRQHYHTTPADLLLRARLAVANHSLLTGDTNLSAVASQAGFETLSVFHENFRHCNGLTPAAYRELRSTRAFRVKIPTGYPLPYLRRALGRDDQSITERLNGNHYTSAIRFGERAAILKLEISSEFLHTEIENGSAVEAHALIVRLLGIDQDASAFARLAKRLGLERLIAEREGMRIVQTHSVFDGLLWSIIGQQINFAFACVLRRRLIERAGTRMTDSLYAPPTPTAVASLTPADLLPLQFSRQKADYLIAAARLVAEGKLDLEALRTMSATRAERTLLAVHGLGPWSVNYLMMRSLGLADCVPLGDTGVTSGLQSLLQLEKRPDIDATRRLMAMFAPFRSLATAHLWQFNKPVPI